MTVTAEMLGLPADRAWIDSPRDGSYLPGTTLQLRAGLTHGVAAPRRTLVLELRGPRGVVARQVLVLTVISENRPIDLSLTLPEEPDRRYELVLETAGERATWSVAVPAQRVDAELVCAQRSVRRGEILRAVIRTGEISLETGVAYGIQRWDGAWQEVDPFAGEPGAWAAVALMIPAFTAWPERVPVPEHTVPGRHRLTKWVDAEHRGIGSVELAGEFEVRDAPAVDYRSLLATGAWLGVVPGDDRGIVRSGLGEPDERLDGDRVWRYGDLELRFENETLHEFFGRVMPDELLDEVADDQVGTWTQRLDSGAQLEIERPHTGTFPRLLAFSVSG